MKPIDGKLYFEFADLIEYGFTIGYLKKATSLYRSGQAKAYANISDPDDGRKCLISYDSIPASAIANKGIPTKKVLLEEYENGQKENIDLAIQSLLKPLSDKDKKDLQDFRIKREQANLNTGEVFLEEVSALPKAKINAYGQACRWLALMAEERLKNKDFRCRISPTFQTLKDFYEACITLYTAEGVALPKNFRKVQEKVAEYKKHGALCLVNRNFGNTRTQKIGQEQLEYLIKLYSDDRKPSFALVTKWYNNAVEQLRTDWKSVAVRTVENNLLQPDVQPVWYMARHGFEAWKELYEYTMLRYKPPFRDALWSIDGTKVNYYYRTEKGTAAKLQVVAVLDAFSECWLGWSFTTGKEDHLQVANAVKMAVKNSGGIKPSQFQYDNGSGNVKFFKEMAGLHFPAMPNNGQSKPIESAFKRLQQQVMRENRYFTGQNITAKELDSKANKAILKELEKENTLPDLAAVLRQAEMDFHIWNNTKVKDGKTRKELYQESQHPHPTFFTTRDAQDVFWQWNDENNAGRPNTYYRTGLQVIFNGKKYNYEAVVMNSDGYTPSLTPQGFMVPDVDFHERNVGQEFWVKYDPDNLRDRVALYIGKDRRFVGYAFQKELMQPTVVSYQPGDRENINIRLDVKKQQKQKTQERLSDITERFDSEELVKLGHSFVDKEALNNAEADYLEGFNRKTALEPEEDELVPVPVMPPKDLNQRKYQAYKNLSFD
ncbi:hypothetical protein [Rufibacter quisquiliarum]|uniref:Integrase catalytic domain-containing protein n=1 Tax=Rufibacter quisquiliarum TaxID=1549639 RepID=A0A839GJD3_9BACT|nr:hypothetical protein [Rufibacter quisquiliarum]MBA9078972.1 hypothetical protein [Rufibacter quisquiliarum]